MMLTKRLIPYKVNESGMQTFTLKKGVIKVIVPRYYENLHVLHENTMPNRSYYIPASKRIFTLVKCREASDRFRLLNGD